jgi:hypothetical protein
MAPPVAARGRPITSETSIHSVPPSPPWSPAELSSLDEAGVTAGDELGLGAVGVAVGVFGAGVGVGFAVA